MLLPQAWGRVRGAGELCAARTWAGSGRCRCLGVVRPAGTSRRRGLGGAGRAPGNVDPASSPPQELPTQREPFRPAPPAGPPAPLPVGSVIGWRRGSLARACGCSYKNPRVPALSCSKLAAALPAQRRCGQSAGASGTPGRPGAGGCGAVPTASRSRTRETGRGLPDRPKLQPQTPRVLPRAHGGAEHGRGAA